MKTRTLQQIKDELAVEHGYSNWDNFMACSAISNAESYYDKVARIYAQQTCENLRERIAEGAKTKYVRYDDPKHNFHGEDVVDKDSIRNVEIRLP